MNWKRIVLWIIVVLIIAGVAHITIRDHKEQNLCQSFIAAKEGGEPNDYNVYEVSRSDKNVSGVFCKYYSSKSGYDWDIFFEGKDPLYIR